MTPSFEPIQLDRALRRRDRLLARTLFWDRWRGILLMPLALFGAVPGFFVGLGVEEALHWPDRTRFIGMALGLVASGRFVTWWFDPRRLTVAQRRLDELRGTRPPGARRESISSRDD